MKSIWVLAVSLYISITSFALDYHVSKDGTGDFLSISLALNTSMDGDTIIVHPGTYDENISINKNIVLTSTYPDDPNTRDNTVIELLPIFCLDNG